MAEDKTLANEEGEGKTAGTTPPEPEAQNTELNPVRLRQELLLLRQFGFNEQTVKAVSAETLGFVFGRNRLEMLQQGKLSALQVAGAMNIAIKKNYKTLYAKELAQLRQSERPQTEFNNVSADTLIHIFGKAAAKSIKEGQTLPDAQVSKALRKAAFKNIFLSPKEISHPIVVSKAQLVQAGLFTPEELGRKSFLTIVAVPDIENQDYVEETRYSDFYGPEKTVIVSHLPSFPVNETERPVYEEITFERGVHESVTEENVRFFRFEAAHREKYPNGLIQTLQSMSITLKETADDPDNLTVLFACLSKAPEGKAARLLGHGGVQFIEPEKNVQARAQCEGVMLKTLEIIKDVKDVAHAVLTNKDCRAYEIVQTPVEQQENVAAAVRENVAEQVKNETPAAAERSEAPQHPALSGHYTILKPPAR